MPRLKIARAYFRLIETMTRSLFSAMAMRKLLWTSLLSACVLAPAPALCAALAPNGDWASYRDAYRAMVIFEKYGKPKSLLQHQIQVLPRDKAGTMEGLRLVLNGQGSQLNLPLDASGRTVFPLLKAAYDDNAELALNRSVGPFKLRARVSLAVRADGIYELAELRGGCEQALAYARYLDTTFAKRNCVGVRFAYGRAAPLPVLAVKRVQPGEAGELPVAEGALFDDAAGDTFNVVNLRFGSYSAQGQVSSKDAPLAIVPLFE